MLLEVLNSTAAILGAVAACLMSYVALLKAKSEERKADVDQGKAEKYKAFSKLLLVAGVCLGVGWSFGHYLDRLPLPVVAEADARSDNERLTTEAWEAFGDKKYEAAIAKARECIDLFEGGADRAQQALEAAGAPLPPTGAVNEEKKQEILSRGLLNDVATCYFIWGRSAEELNRPEEAKEAYRKATRYTYARTWDARGWFFSPAEAAGDRLKRLSGS